MKLLIVNTVPTDRNGITGVIFNYLESIPFDSDDRISFVSINEPDEPFKKRLNRLGIELHIASRSIKNPLRYITNLKKIASGYDIIHVHGNSATMILEMIAAKLAAIPVRIAHSHNTSCSLRIVDKICRPLFYSLCNARMACGEEAGKWLFRNRPFLILNNGIDTEKFKYDSKHRCRIREKLNIDDSTVLFGHIGNFVEAKNHAFLIDIFAAIKCLNPKTKLILLGSGDSMATIKEKVNSLNIANDVIFSGSIDNPQEYLSAIDIIIMPSLFEGLPLTLVEEQANGLSCIVSDTITQEVNMTGNLKFLPLSCSPDTWAIEAFKLLEQTTHSRTQKSTEAIEKIKNKDYDIQKNAYNLKNYYLQKLVEINEK